MFFNRIKQKNKRKIEKLAVENHLLSLEQKALQLQMNPHYIFNVLNGIGIEKSKKQRKKHHQSMTLQVTKDHLENISVKNSLQITEDNGTIISFRIPLKTDS